MLGDGQKCVNQDHNIVLTSLAHASVDEQHDWFNVLPTNEKIVPNQQQPRMSHATLNNHIRNFSSFHEDHYYETYLVHVNDKLWHYYTPMTTTYGFIV